jgi:hypothetical protein
MKGLGCRIEMGCRDLGVGGMRNVDVIGSVFDWLQQRRLSVLHAL